MNDLDDAGACFGYLLLEVTLLCGGFVMSFPVDFCRKEFHRTVTSHEEIIYSREGRAAVYGKETRKLNLKKKKKLKRRENSKVRSPFSRWRERLTE